MNDQIAEPLNTTLEPLCTLFGSWLLALGQSIDSENFLLGNELIMPMHRPPDMNPEIETTARLGGLLRS
jgi:hypothetical protein